MKRTKLFLSILILLPQFLTAQNFLTKQSSLIEQKIDTLIKKYEYYAAFKTEYNGLSFLKQKYFSGLFVSDTVILYNDLSEDKDKTAYLSVYEYLTQLRKIFKTGLSVKVQLLSIDYYRISKKEYIADVKLRKKIVGINADNKIYTFEKNLWIAVLFDKTLKNFKIYSIDVKPSEPDIYIPKEDKGNALEFFVSPSSTRINHDLSAYTDDFSGNSAFKIHFGLRYRQPITGGLNILLGVRHSSFSGNFVLSNYSNEYPSVDADNEEYTRIVNSPQINETQNLSYLDFQFGLQYRVPDAEKVKFYFSASTLYSIVLKSEYTASGTFSYEGYYPQYNITLFDLENYNFPSNKALNYSDELKTTSNISVLFGLGMEIKVSEDVNFNLGLNYQYGLKNISDYETNSYLISDTPNDYDSIMKASASTKLKSYGLTLGLVFIL
jgi:hypothetical protein